MTAVAPKLGHAWGEWETVTEATATTDGEKRRECTREGCDAFETEVIPATGGDDPEPVGEGWGYSNKVTIAGTDYMVVVFTNTDATLNWQVPQGVTAIDYLVVGGGASGGCGGNNSSAGGGGGAGGVVTNVQPCAVAGGDAVSVTVGAGGGGVSVQSIGVSGGKSSLTIGASDPIEALGGGFGGTIKAAGGGGAGVAGGGGGGSGNSATYDRDGGQGTCFKGGNGRSNRGGGGAGAGGNGVDGDEGGSGGSGVAVGIFGETVRIAGGGGGSASGRGATSASPDGGGTGGWKDSYGGYLATSGSTWGAGGGATTGGAGGTSGAGHQGVVVVRYALGGGEPKQPEIDPSTGVGVTVKAARAADAIAKVTVATPEGVTNPEYATYFKLVATPAGEGVWLVTAELKADAVRPEIGGTESGAAFVVGDEGVTLRVVNAKAGLYYGYKSSDTLAGLKDAKATGLQLATEGGERVLTPLKDGEVRFYQVVVAPHARGATPAPCVIQ